MKKTCLLIILLLGLTAINSVGYVLLYPGAIFYGANQTITFSDSVNCSYIEVGDDYFILSDMNFTRSNLGVSTITTSAIYYFDEYDVSGEEWNTNPENMVDGNPGTQALTDLLNDVQLLTHNTVPAKINTINKIELRMKAGYSFGGQSANVTLRPVFSSGDGDNHSFVLPQVLTYSNWFDITTDTNAPSSWIGADVIALECDVETTALTFSATVSIVEIRVNYTYNNQYWLSYFNDTFDNHTSSETPYRFFELNVTYTDSGDAEITIDMPGDYYLIDLYIDGTLEFDNVEENTGGYYVFDHTWVSTTEYRLCFYISGYLPGCPTSGSSIYDTNTTRVNLSWNSSSYADSYVLVRNNGSYPTTVIDGYEVQNSSALFYNDTLTSNAYFTVWGYNNSGYYSPDSCKLDIPWGALRLNVFNASRTWESVDPFGLTVQNVAGDDIFQQSTCTPPFYLDLNDIPIGTSTIFILNASDYKTQTFRHDTIVNTFMNFTFLLPPVKTTTEGEGDEDAEGDPTNFTDSQLYLITLLNEVDQSLMDGLIVFSLYVNETDTYEQIGSFITDGAGQGTIWLVPKKLYKVVCSVPGSDDYQTNTSYWTPSSLLLTKTFKLKYAEDPIRPPLIPQDYITFTATRTNTTLTIIYDDTLLETINTVIYIYEIDLLTGNETLFHTNRTTGVNSFTLTVDGLEANNSYRIVLKYNHTTFGYQDPTLLVAGYRRSVAGEFDTFMVNIFGYTPFLWSNIIMFLILVAVMFYADKEDMGKILILLGGIFIFITVFIGFGDTLATVAGGILPAIFVLVGILMEWKKGKVN